MATAALERSPRNGKGAFPRRFNQIGLFATFAKLPEIKGGETGPVGDILFATELAGLSSHLDRALPDLTSH
jgi:hypothetical protein